MIPTHLSAILTAATAAEASNRRLKVRESISQYGFELDSAILSMYIVSRMPQDLANAAGIYTRL